MVADDDSALLAELRRLRPLQVRVVPSDGSEPRMVAVPNHRKRYHVVNQTLSSLQWSRIECMDAKGALLGIVQADGQVQPEDIKHAPREYALLQLLTSAQKMALEENRQTFDTLLGHFSQLMGVMCDRLGNLERSQAGLLQLATKAQLALANAQNQELSVEDQMMMLAMQKAFGVKLPAQGTTPSAGEAPKQNGAQKK